MWWSWRFLRWQRQRGLLGEASWELGSLMRVWAKSDPGADCGFSFLQQSCLESGREMVGGGDPYLLFGLVRGHEMRESGRGQRWEDRGKRRNGSTEGL